MPMWWWQVRSGFAASPTKVRVGVVLFFSFGKFAVVYLEIGTVAVNQVVLGKLIIIRELWGAQLPGLCGAPGWWWRLLRALVQSGACETPRFIGRRGDGSVFSMFQASMKNLVKCLKRRLVLLKEKW